MKRHLREDMERLAELEASMHPGAQKFSGLPHAPGIKDHVGDLAVELADMRTQIERLAADVSQSEAVVADYAGTIADCFTRILFRLRFIQGLTWKEIAAAVGGRNTANSVKARITRYLDAHIKQ